MRFMHALAARVAMTNLLFLAMPGCGKPKAPAPVHVKGQIIVGTKPAVGIVITFYAQGPLQKLVQPAMALSDIDGKFKLECPPGEYKVTASPINAMTGATAPGLTGPIPAAPATGVQASNKLNDVFMRPNTTPLNVKVFDNGREDLMLTVY